MIATSPPADSGFTRRLANREAVLRSEIDGLIRLADHAHVGRNFDREHNLMEQSDRAREWSELAADVATLSRRLDVALRLIGLILGEHSELLPADTLGPLLAQLDGLTT